MTAPWALVPLGRCLCQVRESITLADDQEYRQVTVLLHGRGVQLRQVVRGVDVKTKSQFVVRAGQLVCSRIDARNGALGLVPPGLEGAVVSSDFPTFAVDGDVAEPRFIEYATRTAMFVEACRAPSRGVTNRQRLKEGQLLAISIPLPPLSEQRRIVALLDQVAHRVEEARRLSEEAASGRQTLLLRQVEELGKGVPCLPLASVAPIVRRAVDVEPETWYPELGIRSFGKGTFHKAPILGAELGGKRIFHIEPGDLLFSNVFAWEGAIAVVQPEDEGRYGSHRFMTCLVDRTQATPEFLCRYFLTDEGMAAIRAASPGAAGRNRTLGIGKLAAIPVPVPPVAAQRRFADLADRVRDAEVARRAAIEALDTLMPAALDRAFDGGM